MKWILFAALVLVGCASEAPDDATNDPTCLGMGVDSPQYPAVFHKVSGDESTYQESLRRFLEQYSDAGVEEYEFSRSNITVGSLISAPPTPSVPLSDSWGEADARQIATSFVQRWSGLLNPYDVDLIEVDCSEPDSDCDPRALYFARQEICGLAIRSPSAFYSGQIELHALAENGALEEIRAGVVPPRPLPEPKLDASGVAAQLKGRQFTDTCGVHEYTGDECLQHLDGPFVHVTERDDSSIEYRIAQSIFLSEHCDSDAFVQVVYDLVDGTILSEGAVRACD